jgi:hypothetical protein
MLKRLTEYLGAKPRRAATIVLTLIIVFVLAVAGLVFQWTLLDNQTRESEDEPGSPYPSDLDTHLTLVNSTVLYVQDFSSDGYGNYSGMRFGLGANHGDFPMNANYSHGRWLSVNPFGNQSQLGLSVRATVIESIWTGSQGNASIEITDIDGDGCFNIGDTMSIMLDPLPEDVVFTMAFFSESDIGGKLSWELSFAVHGSEFFAWRSSYLPWEYPWYDAWG